jgi:hypothetical protein|tara:strand:- start:648 stop:896 length:249 start_codon:yes stop_codon:yes gene_type:complete
MKSQTLTIDQLASIAQEAETKDPVDWSLMTIDKETAYKLMASSVIEQFADLEEDEKMLIALGTITKLLVENFVLNIRLESKK